MRKREREKEDGEIMGRAGGQSRGERAYAGSAGCGRSNQRQNGPCHLACSLRLANMRDNDGYWSNMVPFGAERFKFIQGL